MIPNAFVILEALGLTLNGKVDRHALPEPDLREELELSFVAPQTPEEEISAQIWSQVLGLILHLLKLMVVLTKISRYYN
jgi:hypothetical protein